jgi:hypothetical protein
MEQIRLLVKITLFWWGFQRRVGGRKAWFGGGKDLLRVILILAGEAG